MAGSPISSEPDPNPDEPGGIPMWAGGSGPIRDLGGDDAATQAMEHGDARTPDGIDDVGATPDGVLVERAQNGDRRAFDTLYVRHAGRVFALCLRMAGSRPDAERFTQDAFVLAWRRLRSFRGQSAFGSWLHRIAVNAVLENARREGRHSSRVDQARDTGLWPGTIHSHVDERMDLERAIAQLPPGARAVLVLHDIEGYTHDEIGSMLDIATGTAKAQLHRARRLLREWLNR